MAASRAETLASINKSSLKPSIPEFRTGDTVRVHARIVEGNKERIQVFEGLVIRRHASNSSNATFTVRKVSYSVGVERTFLLHSPRVDKIEVIARGEVRRSRLYYLRDLRGKASRVNSTQVEQNDSAPATEAAATTEPKAENGAGKNGKAHAKAEAAEVAAPAAE